MTVPPQLTSSLSSFSYPASFRHPPPASSSAGKENQKTPLLVDPPFGLKTWKISFISFQLKMGNPEFFNQKVCENDPKMYMFGWSMYIHIFVVENHLMLNGKG